MVTVTELNREEPSSLHDTERTTTLFIPQGEGKFISDSFDLDANVEVNGSLTTAGPIIGSGGVSGSGTVSVIGSVEDSVEPITATIDGTTFVAISGWTTDNDGNEYDAYRFERNGAIEIEKEESLTFNRQ